MSTKQQWTAANIPDLTHKVALVTGANSGLGYQTTLALARKGAQVIMACRSRQKGEQALAQIKRAVPAAALDFRELDLGNLQSVRAFAEGVRSAYDRLDLLINNAGVMALPYRETADGFEMQFGVNHLGHFALTGLLLDLLLATPGARVVTVSSLMHRNGRINFDDLQSQKQYSKWAAYGQSKLANLLFAYELQRRLTAVSASTISVATHPGYAATHLQEAGPNMEGATLQKQIMDLANKIFAQSAAMGALPTLYAATAADVHGGEFYGPDGFGGARGYPTRTDSSPRSHDMAAAVKLWQVSEKLTGVTYPALEKLAA